MAGLTALVLSLQFSGFAQTDEDHDSTVKKFGDNDEIVIKPKHDVDVKLNVEIKKDGQVLVNGKPVDEFDDNNVSVRKKKIMVMDGRTLTLRGLDDLGSQDEMMDPEGSFHKKGGLSFDGVDMNRAFLGVSTGKSEDNAEGARVKGVTKGSGAEKAGLKEGDLITKIDEIAISNPQDLVDAIHKYKPEDKVTVTYKRDGKEQKTTAVLGKFNEEVPFTFNFPKGEGYNFRVPPMPPMPPYGDGVHPFSWDDGRPKLGIRAQDMEDGKGAKVLVVNFNSPAEKAGIREGDIITRFDGKDVDNATTLADLAHSSNGKTSIKINVTRDGKSQEIEVKIPKKLKTSDL